MVMRKVARNDPCHCGSGIIYRKCCYPKDRKDNVIRIAPDAPVSEQAERSARREELQVDRVIEEGLLWHHELYKSQALLMWRIMADRYEKELILEAIVLWHAFASSHAPIVRKPGAYPAAIESTIAAIHRLPVTKSEIARRYQVSVGTISSKVERILLFAEQLLPLDATSSETTFPAKLPKKIQHGQTPFIKKESRKHASSAKMDAEQLLFLAWEESLPKKRIKLAHKALELYPNSPDAYNILAECADNLADAARYYQRGIIAGENDLGQEFFSQNKGIFWGLEFTRPYMRSKLGYAQILWEMGEFSQAIRHYEQLIELCNSDHIGVRYLLLECYLEVGMYEEASALLQRFDEDCANFNYNRVLLEFYLRGITGKLAALYQKARQQNHFVVDYLTNRKKIPADVPESIGFGDINEAIDYAQTHYHLWLQEPKLLFWLKGQDKK